MSLRLHMPLRNVSSIIFLFCLAPNIFPTKQETGELKSQVLRLRGDLSRLEKAIESRDTEDGHRVVDCKTKMKPELGWMLLVYNEAKGSELFQRFRMITSIINNYIFFDSLIVT